MQKKIIENNYIWNNNANAKQNNIFQKWYLFTKNIIRKKCGQII